MKTFIILFAVLSVTLAQTYSTTHDGLDIEALVTNPTTLKELTDCFTDAGPCNDTADAFKKVLPEATQTACAKCTPAQKHMLKRYLQEIKKTPSYVEALQKKYDPENKYIEPLRAALADA